MCMSVSPAADVHEHVRADHQAETDDAGPDRHLAAQDLPQHQERDDRDQLAPEQEPAHAADHPDGGEHRRVDRQDGGDDAVPRDEARLVEGRTPTRTLAQNPDGRDVVGPVCVVVMPLSSAGRPHLLNAKATEPTPVRAVTPYYRRTTVSGSSRNAPGACAGTIGRRGGTGATDR